MQKSPEVYIAELDDELNHGDYLALSLLVRTRTDYEQIFQKDPERLSKLIDLVSAGARPVAVLCVVMTNDGPRAGSCIFENTSDVRHVVEREVAVCRRMLEENSIQCTVH